MKLGYFLSSEEYGPAELLEQATLAEEAGFDSLWISDHFHPWTREQGQSSFVWSMIGAIAQATDLPVATAVSCPTVRFGPVLTAQAAATSAVLLGGRFRLGVGTGESLNEHVTGAPWPPADVRREMLVEAIEVIRALWTGEVVDHHGPHYTVENARIFTRPDTPPEILVSAFGPDAAAMAAEVGDGLVTTSPEESILDGFREGGGTGIHGGFKVGWAQTEDEGVAHAHRLWAIAGLPGELNQVLPTPEHFEQASSLVTEDATREATVCGPDVERHVAAYQPYLDAGFDEIYVGNMGPHYREMITAYGEQVLPKLRGT